MLVLAEKLPPRIATNNYRKKQRLYRAAVFLAVMILYALTPVVHAGSIDQLTINYIEVSPVPEHSGNEVRAYITVSGSDQEPVSGLSAENFNVLEDGKPLDIRAASQTADPMSVVLVIDTSGSMQASDKSGRTSMDAAKSAAVDFIGMLSQEDKVAVYSFNHQTTLDVDFTSDHNAATTAVQALSAKYRAATCLYDTAIEAIKKSAEIPKGRRAVILLTDGKDEKGSGKCSVHGVTDVIDAATTKTIRVPIYTIGAGPKVDARELSRIASLTGGRSLIASAMSELTGFYQTIANQLKNQYEVKYLTRTTSGEHSLVVKARQDAALVQDEKRFWSPPPPVSKPPTVKILTPRAEDKIADKVNVRLQITPEETLSKVRYYLDAALKQEITTPPLTRFKWDTTALSPGLHVLRIEAVDVNERIGSAELTVTITAPKVEIVQPASNQEISGTISVNIRVTSEEALSKMAYYIDNVRIGETTNGPFEKFKLDTSDMAPGHHTLRVELIDRYNRKGTAELPIRKAAKSAAGRLLPWIIVLLIVCLALGAGIVFRNRNRKKGIPEKTIARKDDIQREEKTPDIEDETIFISDTDTVSQPSVAKIKVVSCPGVDSGKTYTVLGNTRIGRHESNEIHLPEKSISRKHVEIYFNEGAFQIRDLGSKYGTTVDDRRISLEVAKLSNGATIKLGPKVVIEFECDEIEDENALTQEISFEVHEETQTQEDVELTETIQLDALSPQVVASEDSADGRSKEELSQTSGSEAESTVEFKETNMTDLPRMAPPDELSEDKENTLVEIPENLEKTETDARPGDSDPTVKIKR
jgi:VWFA-related protein